MLKLNAYLKQCYIWYGEIRLAQTRLAWIFRVFLLKRQRFVTRKCGCVAESTIPAMMSSQRHDVIACQLRHALSRKYIYACLGTQETTPRHTYNIPPHFIRMKIC